MLLTQMVGVGELTADPGSSLWGSLADEGALYDCLSQVCFFAILAVCDSLSASAWPARLEALMSSPALTARATRSRLALPGHEHRLGGSQGGGGGWGRHAAHFCCSNKTPRNGVAYPGFDYGSRSGGGRADRGARHPYQKSGVETLPRILLQVHIAEALGGVAHVLFLSFTSGESASALRANPVPQSDDVVSPVRCTVFTVALR